MSRPRKNRRICSPPRCTSFRAWEGGGRGRGGPGGPDRQAIIMALDEYEVIRLIDWEGMTQEECARQMEVARTTVQAIYAAARKKLAEFIVQGRALHIRGGSVRVCEHHVGSCGRACRHRQGIENGKDETGNE